MKFTDGYWKVRKDIALYNVANVGDYTISQDTVTLYANTAQITDKGATLGGVLLTMTITSPAPETLRVKIEHHKGVLRPVPSFVPDECMALQVEDTADALIVASGKLRARIHKSDWKIEYLDGDRFLTESGWRSTGYAAEEESGYVKEELLLSVGECVYGLGEHFTPFVKNGQVVETWNRDGGTASEQAYKCIPFYLTNRGYGVLVNDSGNVAFEVASEKVERVQFSVPGESMEYVIINGPDPKGVLSRYTALTGRPAMPPAWSFGLWLSTSFTTDYDEKTVMSFVNGMHDRDLPLHVFHFDCFWMRAHHWCDFVWDPATFPDPEGMLKRMKASGLHICVWINPYIAQRSHLFGEGMAQGYLLKCPDGSVWQTDEWQPGMGIVDFTNPDACKWYANALKRLLDMGVDVFKTDFGERIPTNAAYFDGSDPQKMHNYYTYLYNKTVFEALKDHRGEGEALVFARSATVGGQKFPVHWGGDCTATYESMAESLRGGLSLSLCGFGFWSHDMGGFENTAPPDVYKRWVAFGMLSTHSRLHGSKSYRVPWLFDEESVDVLRYFTKLKARLMPYLYTAAKTAHETGVPMMRAMMLEFDDPACEYLDRQYMLGDSLLVAPVLDKRGEVRYYLPDGRWTNLLSNKVSEGGRWQNEIHDFLSLPLMVRENTILPLGEDDTRPDYDYTKDVALHIFELGDGKTACIDITNSGGDQVHATAARTGNRITVDVTGSKPYTVCLRGIHAVQSVTGGKSYDGALGMIINPDTGAREIVVELE